MTEKLQKFDCQNQHQKLFSKTSKITSQKMTWNLYKYLKNGTKNHQNINIQNDQKSKSIFESPKNLQNSKIQND